MGVSLPPAQRGRRLSEAWKAKQGGEGTVLSLLRPMQKTLSVFNERGQVLHLRSASN